ncbi:Lipase 3 [Cryptotermes secundus]|uniref:Lipase 3 n=1 Tax=Cryptotermes secundus TaxID=105785 RepID=A0A2J7QG21_9NEOP|nr:Lipase 3 [Cryptotermes secundus]
MWVCVPQVYLVLLVGMCQLCGSVSVSSLLSGNSTIAEVFNVIENALESVNLLNLIPSLENNNGNPDQYLNTPELIEKYGYPAEIHTVTTEDSYILTVHRIPYSPKSPAAPNKPVVFLQHGILSSSADWIILGPENSLGYLLADAGFDVWLGNARGNTYSKKHLSLSTSDSKFWDFSWHEMGIYDLPAAIDYVLEQTSQPDLYYIGHSMGTTMFFVMTSTLTEYNSKIRLMTALAPIAYMAFVKSPISKFFGANPLTKPLVRMLGINEFLPNGKLTSSILGYVCSDGSIIQQVCSTALFALCGYNPQELNTVSCASQLVDFAKFPLILRRTNALKRLF